MLNRLKTKFFGYQTSKMRFSLSWPGISSFFSPVTFLSSESQIIGIVHEPFWFDAGFLRTQTNKQTTTTRKTRKTGLRRLRTALFRHIYLFIYLFIHLFIRLSQPMVKGQRIICKGVLNPIKKQIAYDLMQILNKKNKSKNILKVTKEFLNPRL